MVNPEPGRPTQLKMSGHCCISEPGHALIKQNKEDELWEQIQEEMQNLSMDELAKYAASVSGRIQEVYRAQGRHIAY